MRVVWLDRVFIINLIADLLPLLAAGRLCAIRVKLPRLLLGAVFGAVYSCFAVIKGGWSELLPVRIAVGVLLPLVVYGGEERLLRTSLIFFLCSAAMAGVTLAVSLALGESGAAETLSVRALLITLALTTAALTAVFKFAAARRSKSDGMRDVRFSYGGKSISLRALSDTGNVLRDPVNGELLPIAEMERLAPLIGGEAERLLSPGLKASPSARLEMLYDASPGLRCRLIPYSAVGVSDGMLVAMRVDSVSVDGEPRGSRWVALSPNRVSENGEYSVLV